MITQQSLIEFLDRFFQVDHYPEEERGGIYRANDRPIQRLGLMLEPIPNLDRWIKNHRIDSLFIHRPWQLDPEFNIGVVSYHLPFDERLTLGFNLRLMETLLMINVRSFGEKSGRSIGMIGEVSPQTVEQYCQQVREVFGGYESVLAQRESVRKAAVVGAMNETLVRSAADQGIEVYITGQFRVSAKSAVLETGINVIEVGHRRSEQWGLKALSGVLKERWSGLQVVLI
ncbi:Nif3-like dinuclear metal center hexameric protein [Leptolyngbya sp. AN03gr2]|uniref:Nif3-like dinuclear metal center hexameric protein n=1 Tax=unclassified Leptolyngbya TaxID=2650499 RepID=UPI003D30F490